MAWVVGETSVGPPSGVDPVGTMRLRISNNNNNNNIKTFFQNTSLQCVAYAEWNNAFLKYLKYFVIFILFDDLCSILSDQLPFIRSRLSCLIFSR